MIIKVERVDGEIEIYEGSNYRITKVKDFHPIISKVSVYDNGRKIESVKRPFSFIYKHFIFKSKKVQEELRNIEKEMENQEKVEKNEG